MDKQTPHILRFCLHSIILWILIIFLYIYIISIYFAVKSTVNTSSFNKSLKYLSSSSVYVRLGSQAATREAATFQVNICWHAQPTALSGGKKWDAWLYGYGSEKEKTNKKNEFCSISGIYFEVSIFLKRVADILQVHRCIPF